MPPHRAAKEADLPRIQVRPDKADADACPDDPGPTQTVTAESLREQSDRKAQRDAHAKQECSMVTFFWHR
jgi:hypothetical protein